MFVSLFFNCKQKIITMKLQLTRISSLLLTGLIAGTFFYGTYCVLPAFYEVSTETHLHFRTTLMKHNKIIVMALVLVDIIALALYLWQARKEKIVRLFIFVALFFTISSLLITRLGSVPINLIIKTWNPISPPADWLKTLATWDLYNQIRTFTSIGSFICLLLADLWLVKYFKGGKIYVKEAQ